MGKFSRTASAAVSSPIKTIGSTPDTVTHEGGAGFSRDPKSELFLLAVANMVGENTFYESGASRDGRFEALIQQVTQLDAGWVRRFVPYLRGQMNMRSASVVMAAEYVKAGGGDGRAVINSALQRADEPAEVLAYWIGKYGKKLPKPVKRGLADAVIRLYNERSALKYDRAGATVRMADVIELSHPKPKADWQGKLFAYLISKRHNREEISLEGLSTIASHGETAKLSQAEIRDLIAKAVASGGEPTSDEGTGPDGELAETENFLEAGGWTWEALSAAYGKLDAPFWEAMIPQMGIFALVRNLRNFDEAKVSPTLQAVVAAKLTDPVVIAKSRMFPLRFYSAWANTSTMNWGPALERALELSMANVPALKGRTLVLVDVSGSMAGPMSDKSKAARWQVAGLFGAALALRAEKANLVTFQSDSRELPFAKVGSALRILDEIQPHVGGGTNTWQAVERHYDMHDRVIILTDEQAFPYGGDPLARLARSNPNAVVYTFNVAGYRAAHGQSSPKHHTFGGLSDAGFTAIDLLERGKDANWPF